MEKRLSRFGIGPRMLLSAVAYALVAGAATHAWPDACLLRWPPYAVFATVGWILLAHGRGHVVDVGYFGDAGLQPR